jgi:hypothetical protein
MVQPAHEEVDPTTRRPVYPASPTPSRGWTWAALGVRFVLTLVGAAGLIISGFMDWIRDTSGVDLSIRSLWETRFNTDSGFLQTVGFAVIVLGLLAILGLAPRTGWLARAAGALGIIVFVLFLIQVYRADQTVNDLQPGAWLCLAGAVVALIGGFFGTRTTVVTTATPATTVVEET